MGLLIAIGCVPTALADVTISARATSNMSCNNGICEPIAPRAVLNVGDLENYIAEFGNMTVQTTGNGVEAENIVVDATFASPGSTTLNLDAAGAIRVNAPVTIGSGGQLAELEMVSDAGGELGILSFGPQGDISFGSASDIFGINGGIFTLVDSLPALASAVAANPAAFYALANSYDAKGDGTYRSAPVGITFTGYFEALGNRISHLKIANSNYEYVGLFADVDGGGGFGVVRNLKMEDVSVRGAANEMVGSIAGYVSGGATLSQSSATGRVTAGDSSQAGGLAGGLAGTIVSSWARVKVGGGGEYAAIGGLVGNSGGSVRDTYAAGTVSAGGTVAFIGGLAGESGGSISASFATGAVNGVGGSYAGGLVGAGLGSVADCYATGTVSDSGGDDSALGGLIGFATVGAADSYATGAVGGVGSDNIGGLVGYDESSDGFVDTYWDVSTSGVSQGAGNIDNDPGITGLTSKQLRAGLPDGFKKTLWKEKASINRGWPYLRDNPPPK